MVNASCFPCSILYADIVGFTRLASDCSPGELVHMLNELFGKFDQIAKVSICRGLNVIYQGWRGRETVPYPTNPRKLNAPNMLVHAAFIYQRNEVVSVWPYNLCYYPLEQTGIYFQLNVICDCKPYKIQTMNQIVLALVGLVLVAGDSSTEQAGRKHQVVPHSTGSGRKMGKRQPKV